MGPKPTALVVALLGALPALGDPPAEEAAATPPPFMATVPEWAKELGDAMNRVLAGERVHEAWPFPVEQVAKRMERELEGFLRRSRAASARLEVVELNLVFTRDEAHLRVGAKVHPVPAGASLLALVGEPEAGNPSVATWSGSLSPLQAAVGDLAGGLTTERCPALPVVTDEELARIVPPAFLERARGSLQESRAGMPELCAALEGAEGPTEVALGTLHFNLYDESGGLVGGVETRLLVAEPPYQAEFPVFKAIPEPAR